VRIVVAQDSWELTGNCTVFELELYPRIRPRKIRLAIRDVRAAPVLAGGVLLAFCTAAAECSAAEATGSGTQVSFKGQIQPILDANCVICHQSASAQEGLVLEDGKAYAHIVGKPGHEASMLLVSPRSAESSYLFRKIDGTHIAAHGRGERMPLGEKLNPNDIKIVRSWIEAGAENN
jgi:mono/diheme cytochrome c family protein